MIEALKEAALIVGYLSTLAGVAVAVYKICKKIDKKLSTIEAHTLENYKDIKRLTFVSEEMPMSERLDAGEKYVKAGGNGEVKMQYKILKKEYEERLTDKLRSGGEKHEVS